MTDRIVGYSIRAEVDGFVVSEFSIKSGESFTMQADRRYSWSGTPVVVREVEVEKPCERECCQEPEWDE